MAFVFTPTCPGTGPWYIDREDCIGDSLLYINANTGYLDCKIDSLSANTSTQINTVTTTLSTVPYARLNDGNQTGSAPLFGVRAWARWAGIAANGAVPSFTGGNISSIARIGSGLYEITLALPMLDSNYAVIVNSTSFASRLDTFIPTTTKFRVEFFSQAGAVQNPTFCSVVIIR